MIKLVRVDDRLIHGQVAYSWKAGLNYDAIIIANDNIINDEFRKSALKLACPTNVKLAIRNIRDAVDLINNPRLLNMNIFVVLESIKDAYNFYNILNDTPSLNIGGLKNKEKSYRIMNSIYITKEEEELLKEIRRKNIEVFFQLVPNDDKVNFN